MGGLAVRLRGCAAPPWSPAVLLAARPVALPDHDGCSWIWTLARLCGLLLSHLALTRMAQYSPSTPFARLHYPDHIGNSRIQPRRLQQAREG